MKASSSGAGGTPPPEPTSNDMSGLGAASAATVSAADVAARTRNPFDCHSDELGELLVLADCVTAGFSAALLGALLPADVVGTVDAVSCAATVALLRVSSLWGPDDVAFKVSEGRAGLRVAECR